MFLRIVLILVMLLTYLNESFSQYNSDIYQLKINKTTEPIIVDGELEEHTWQTADRASNFITVFPEDSLVATSQSVAMLAYDDAFLYISGICYVNSDKDHIIQSLKRDFSWPFNDNFSVYIDPYDDYTNGFTFGITPAGVAREGLVNNGGRVSADWDNKWFVEVKNFEDRWQFEMKIPFKTIRYNYKSKQWNITFLRKDLKNNEESTWAPVPQGFRPNSFAFSGKVLFDTFLDKAGPNIALIPFTSLSRSRNFEDNEPRVNQAEFGFDAKIGLSSSLNLDVTYNSDFSQVEVDRQVTNLSRFEIFFPERRQFFLENRDLFDEGGFREVRPFFSRRIGIAKDTADNNILLPILYGARISGKMGKDWRMGVLNMTTQGRDGALLSGVDEIEGKYDLLSQNYTVGIIQRRIFSRSNINFTGVNRQSIGYNDEFSTSSTTKYNRTFGIDYNLLSTDGKWTGDMYYYKSFDEEKRNDDYSMGAFLNYTNRNVQLRGLAYKVGEGYNPEVGFVPRKDVIRLSTFNDFIFYPEKSKIVRHGPGVNVNYFTDSNFNKTDLNVSINYGFVLKNTSGFGFSFDYDFVKLRDLFDPTGQLEDDDLKLQKGEQFDWRSVSLGYESDRRKTFSVQAGFSQGGFYNGKRTNANTAINYRFQPYGIFALEIDYNKLYAFPERFEETSFWLVGPRMDLTFSKKTFLSTIVQYNEQADNVNVNMRLQWRFRPVSDLFIVYSDNYLPENFEAKSRAIIFKFTYWLNL